MIRDSIELLLEKKDLPEPRMRQVMREILSGEVGTLEIADFLTALSAKGETIEELTAAVRVMLEHVDPISVDRPNILDTCGTGGDQKGSFNISTLAAFSASGAGVTVAKHGNRSVSSRCGSADVLEALGVDINMNKAKIKKCLEDIGIAFLFAPNLHPAMRAVMPARKQIAQKTMFNILGPLINPARATNQLVGVYSRRWVKPLAQVLYNLGSKHVLVVHGSDGLDEVTTTGETFVTEVKDGLLRDYQISPEEFGLRKAGFEELSGGTVEENARIITEVLSGKRGSRRDIVLLNAGCAIYAADKADSIGEGIKLAQEAIDSGKALKKLELLKEYSR